MNITTHSKMCLHVPESHVTMVVSVSYQGLLGIAGVHPGTREHFVKVGIRVQKITICLFITSQSYACTF
jgi:hypothetical protein